MARPSPLPGADAFHLWWDLSMLSIEAAQVISLRMMLLAGGGRVAERETQRMVDEKLQALTQLGWKLAWGQWGNLPQRQMEGATKLYGRKVNANLRRLSGS
jgi:hypothetical protein